MPCGHCLSWENKLEAETSHESVDDVLELAIRARRKNDSDCAAAGAVSPSAIDFTTAITLDSF
jgi:hypothetical protein